MSNCKGVAFRDFQRKIKQRALGQSVLEVVCLHCSFEIDQMFHIPDTSEKTTLNVTVIWDSLLLKKVCHHRSCKIVNSNTLHLNTSDLETAYAVNSVIGQWNLILVWFSRGVVSEALSQMLYLWNISMSFRSVSSQEAPKSHKDSCKNLINPIHRTYDTCGSVMLEHFRKRNVPRNLSDTNSFLIPVHVHITLHYEKTNNKNTHTQGKPHTKDLISQRPVIAYTKVCYRSSRQLKQQCTGKWNKTYIFSSIGDW